MERADRTSDEPTGAEERIRRALLRITAPKAALARWTTSSDRYGNRRSVRVCEMSDRHLENLIKLVERSPNGGAAKKARESGLWPVLVGEAERRGLVERGAVALAPRFESVDYAFNPWDE